MFAQFVTDKTRNLIAKEGSFGMTRSISAHKTTVGVVFIPFHFSEAAANLLTIDALDPQAKIPEYKACAVRVIPAKESELAKPEAGQVRGRY
jgi:predicted molibdopterin-dependent oxidoreductase YjgC